MPHLGTLKKLKVTVKFAVVHYKMHYYSARLICVKSKGGLLKFDWFKVKCNFACAEINDLSFSENTTNYVCALPTLMSMQN